MTLIDVGNLTEKAKGTGGGSDELMDSNTWRTPIYTTPWDVTLSGIEGR
jgi:hypothetical protein